MQFINTNDDWQELNRSSDMISDCGIFIPKLALGGFTMAVFRLERTRDYTVMSNHHLRDKRLSLKAKGLLSQMLSLPDDWDYTLSGLAYINRESKDAIRSAVNELERAGYVQRHQTTNASGKFSVNEYIIYERPISANPSSEKPSSDNPTPDKPLQDIWIFSTQFRRTSKPATSYA